MLYDITDKLNFNKDPQIKIKDTTLTVKSDAETVLKVMGVVRNKGEIDGILEAAELIFSVSDRKKLQALRLNMTDYVEVIQACISLATGDDPNEEEATGEG